MFLLTYVARVCADRCRIGHTIMHNIGIHRTTIAWGEENSNHTGKILYMPQITLGTIILVSVCNEEFCSRKFVSVSFFWQVLRKMGRYNPYLHIFRWRREVLERSDTSNQRSPIPDPMKREVRQRCGFGCVICGMPLYTYEHIWGYANVKRHVASELTLLCDQHQRESTNKLLSREQIIRADKDPYNLQEGVSKPYTLHYEGSDCAVDVGGNVFSFRDDGSNSEFVAFAIDEESIISFKLDNGHWLLNLNVYDRNDNLILLIADNELIYSTTPWDIQLVGHNLVIREAEGKILVDTLFEPPSQIKIQRGHFLHNGIEVEIKPDCLYVVNNHSRFSLNRGFGLNGINLGTQKDKNWGFCMNVGPRYVTNRTNSS